MLLSTMAATPIAAVRGERREILLGAHPVGEGIAGWVAVHHEPLILKGVITDERFSAAAPRADQVSPVHADDHAEQAERVLNVTAPAGREPSRSARSRH